MIVQDVIPKIEQDFLEDFFLNPKNNFPWFMNLNTLTNNEGTNFTDANTVDCPYFYHSFIVDGKLNSNALKLVLPIADKLGKKTDIKTNNIFNIRTNLTFPDVNCKKKNYKPPHIDTVANDVITAIYYVNDSDGDTLFFNKNDNKLKVINKISPQKGSIVYFDSKQIHCGLPPKKNLLRCVINFNFSQV